MSLLTPWALWIAAIAVPALLVLYFLRLRRREQRVPSTFLWQRAVREMQVNAPFQRLRKNLLLFLQLLVLALAILALARPVIQSALTSETSIVLLIDRSASMNAIEDGDRTRLELAKEQAVRLVRTLNQSSGRWLALFSPQLAAQTQVMVIAFSDRAEVVVPFTTDTVEAARLIDDIRPSDGRTNLPEALQLAEAYLTQTRIEQTVESAQPASRLVLISDGAVPPMKDVPLKAGGLKFIPIGQAGDNLGLTALRAQRSYESPEILSIFGQVQNFGPQPVTADLALYVDGRLETVWDVRVDGRAAPEGETTASADRRGSAATVNRDFPLDKAGLVELRLVRKDALAVDDKALFLAPAPRKLRALLVSERNFFLEQVLRSLPLETFDYLTPAQYAAAPAERIEADGRSRYDVVIFDKQASERLPAGNYLLIECVPPGIAGLETAGEIGAHAMLWWDDTHPVLRHVGLDYVYAGKGLEVKFPPDAQTLIEGPRGPTLARFVDTGRQFIVLTFAVESSTMWASPSLPVFVYNAVRFLGAGAALGESEPLRPGDPLRVALVEGQTAELLRPDGQRATLRGGPEGAAYYAATDRVGLYATEGDPPAGGQRFAVNLEGAAESDIAPRTDLGFGSGVEVVIGEPIETSTPEIWRWFLGAALVIAMLEWYIYNRRVML